MEIISEKIIPEIRTRRFINIWDAGCAMGPEPYTLAIILRENLGRMIFRNVKIYATDIDLSNLFGDIIKKGLYSSDQLGSVPPGILAQYFSKTEDGKYLISEELRKSVFFEKHDLLSYQPVKTGFSMIVCKNVLLHFREEQRIKVIKMFYESLAHDGYFVTERTQKMPHELMDFFYPISTNAMIFKKKS